MSIDRHQVDQLLRSIKLGHLTPESAARRLLASVSPADLKPARSEPPRNVPPAPQQNSIESLITQLGAPPAEIASDWQRQITAFTESWLLENGRPLPPVALADWLVDSQNRLTLNPQTTLHSSAPTAALLPLNPAAKPAPVPKRPRSIRVAAVALLTVAAVVGGVIKSQILPSRYQLAQSNHSPTAPDAGASKTIPPEHRSSSTSSASPAAASFTSPTASSSPDDLQLGLTMVPLESPPTVAIDLTNPPSDWGLNNPLLTGLQLDVPSPTDTATDRRGDSPVNSSNDLQPANAPAPSFSDAGPELSDAESMVEEEPAESIDVSRPIESASPQGAITLPPIPAAKPAVAGQITAAAEPDIANRFAENSPPLDAVVVARHAARDLLWDFPVDTKLSFQPRPMDVTSTETSRSWVWTDSTDQAELATLRTVDQQLVFQWTSSASTHPLARQIAAGRLSVVDLANNPSTIFLRPQLRTPALRFELEQADNRLSWPLQGPPIFDSPELTLAPFVPEKIEWTWLQSPDPRDVRKQTSTLQWALAGKPSPLIQCRIECRTNTRLQMRLRYLVQLDPRLPWQPFSAPQLLLAIDYVTQTLERAVAQQTELQHQYRAAASSDKRSLKPLKDATEATVKRLNAGLQQLQQLNLLQSTIAAEAYLSITLTTAWPESNQTILQTPPPDQ